MDGISHLVIEVSDLKRSEEFYHDILGFELLGQDQIPNCGRNSVLGCASGQWLILSESAEPRSLAETGVHQAYGMLPSDREGVAKKLAERSIVVHRYKEDRPAEEGDNFYFHDPDGNRIQSVTGKTVSDPRHGVLGIDHAAMECHDLEWAEDFYVRVLGLTVEHRVGWRTEDYVRAKLWGDGKANMAPGTRRWDQRYTVMEQKRLLPRPNTQLYVQFGDSTLGIYLATKHRQEPPERQIVGTPRIGLRCGRAAFHRLVKVLAENHAPLQGPVEHPLTTPIAASLYVKDPGANFLEICVSK